MNHRRTINVLLINNDLPEAELICEVLSQEADIKINILHANMLSLAMNFLTKGEFDVILCDLSLPDSVGIETFMHIHNLVPNIPIIVLTGLDERETASRAVSKGARDYIFVKGQIHGRHLLSQAILYSLERIILLTCHKKKITAIRTQGGLLAKGRYGPTNGYWGEVEESASVHSKAAFTYDEKAIA